MGGFGSGKWTRYNRKTKTSHVTQINISEFRKWDCLPGRGRNEPYGGYLQWSGADAEPDRSVGFEIRSDSLVLSFVFPGDSESPSPIWQTISFDRTRCNYGGERFWFLCPSCGTRVAVLYLFRRRFACRHCHQLPYASQAENLMDRMYRKCMKIRRRLGASMSITTPISQKPARMHWKTFERLRQQERIANDRRTIAWLQDADSFLNRIRA